MKSQFENHREQSEERLPITQKTLDEAYEKALKILSEPIDPSEFNYRDLQRDIDFVKKVERQFDEQSKKETLEQQNRRKIGKIVEAIIFEQAELSNWFGESATTIQTSRYDDIVNKVDAIVEFNEGEPSNTSHLALAMDVTTANHFEEKFQHIKKSLERGELAKVKYFVSETLGFRGEKSGIPHVVIGADRETIFDVIEAWTRGDKKKLANHPVQIKILEEVRLQLEAFKKYAEKIGQTQVVRVYEKTLVTINNIMLTKEITADDLRAVEKDNFFSTIKRYAEEIAEGRTPSGWVVAD